ncbi:hypothetical protein NQ314_010267 [Rhamnusium bicolor]|uniref:Uncharacterized protein n=1 Tax=Rhamnusium bicolor TaxID=1586634 RepID=A0AAV8XTB5_9CUCU|nr:hypothetical protein NQ314_010267 [Rhamnusium bicolor]
MVLSKWCTEDNCCDSIYGEYPPGTKCVKIEETNIIPSSAFVNSTELIYVYGVNSKIEILGVRSFVNLGKLINIHLPFNMIREIHGEVFVNVSATLLDLSWNKIYCLNQHAFDGLYNLKYLNLSRNVITTFQLLPNNPFLEELILSYNMLTTVALSSYRYPNLTNIDLSFNKLTGIALSFVEPIRKLDLTYNSLNSFSVSDFAVEELKNSFK